LPRGSRTRERRTTFSEVQAQQQRLLAYVGNLAIVGGVFPLNDTVAYTSTNQLEQNKVIGVDRVLLVKVMVLGADITDESRQSEQATVQKLDKRADLLVETAGFSHDIPARRIERPQIIVRSGQEKESLKAQTFRAIDTTIQEVDDSQLAQSLVFVMDPVEANTALGIKYPNVSIGGSVALRGVDINKPPDTNTWSERLRILN
jgi:hypothetical protein